MKGGYSVCHAIGAVRNCSLIQRQRRICIVWVFRAHFEVSTNKLYITSCIHQLIKQLPLVTGIYKITCLPSNKNKCRHITFKNECLWYQIKKYRELSYNWRLRPPPYKVPRVYFLLFIPLPVICIPKSIQHLLYLSGLVTASEHSRIFRKFQNK